MSNVNFSMNASNVTHDHNYTFNSIGAISDANHAHNALSPAGSMGASQKNGPAGTSGGALLGNHTHTYNTNANIFTGVGGAAHSHAAAINGNSGLAGDASHTHTSYVQAASTSSNIAVDGISGLDVPYANMLYFIKA